MLNNGFVLKGYNENIGEFRLIPLDHDSEDDYEIYKKFILDKHLMKTSSLFNGNVPSNEDDIKHLFELKTKSHEHFRGIGYYKIQDENSNVFGVGGTVLLEEEYEKPKIVELGIFLQKNYQNKGLSYQILRQIQEQCFIEYETVEKMVTTSLINNHISPILATRLGFNFVGIVKNNSKQFLLFKLSRKDFFENQNKNIRVLSMLKTVQQIQKNQTKVLKECNVLNEKTRH